jgi:predicted nucleotidyltransferase
MTTVDLTAALNALAAGRQKVLDRIITAVRDSGAGALLLVGSLGRGGGDAFSDLDLIIVPGPSFTGLDLAELFDNEILASLEVPRNAPVGGSYTGLCLDVADAVLWVDAYFWPASTAAVPADAVPVFDDVNLPSSDLTFIPLITQHSDPSAAAHPSNNVTMLLRVAVAAKYLARGDLDRIVDKLPIAAGLNLEGIPALLYSLLGAIDEPELARAVTGTAALVDLSHASSGTRSNRSRS